MNGVRAVLPVPLMMIWVALIGLFLAFLTDIDTHILSKRSLKYPRNDFQEKSQSAWFRSVKGLNTPAENEQVA